MFLKASADIESVIVTALRAERAFAGNGCQRTTAAKIRRDAHVNHIIARDIGMHASPPGPLGIDMEVAAHKKRPWSKNRVYGQEKYSHQCKKDQKARNSASGGPALNRRNRWRRIRKLFHEWVQVYRKGRAFTFEYIDEGHAKLAETFLGRTILPAGRITKYFRTNSSARPKKQIRVFSRRFAAQKGLS
jgi:hypothetical protein